MVSDRLEAFASHFRQWAANPTGVALEPQVLSTLATEIGDCAGQVRALEGRPVPPASRNLVHLDRVRAVRQGNAGCAA